MADEIKTGDTVALKSGGPNMTISAVEENYGVLTAWCDWWDGKKMCNGTFPVTSLVVT